MWHVLLLYCHSIEQRNLQSCFQIVTLAIEGVLAEDADVSMPI